MSLLHHSFGWQVGIPSSREQYVHRLGRTGRAGKEGEGILLLSPDEEFFLRELKDLPIARLPDATAQPPAQSVEVSFRPACSTWPRLV